MPLSETITEGAGKTQRDAYRDVLLDMLSGVLQAVQWDPLKGAALAAIDVLRGEARTEDSEADAYRHIRTLQVRERSLAGENRRQSDIINRLESEVRERDAERERVKGTLDAQARTIDELTNENAVLRLTAVAPPLSVSNGHAADQSPDPSPATRACRLCGTFRPLEEYKHNTAQCARCRQRGYDSARGIPTLPKGQKWCRVCQVGHPLEEFPPSKRSLDGRHYICTAASAESAARARTAIGRNGHAPDSDTDSVGNPIAHSQDEEPAPSDPEPSDLTPDTPPATPAQSCRAQLAAILDAGLQITMDAERRIAAELGVTRTYVMEIRTDLLASRSPKRPQRRCADCGVVYNGTQGTRCRPCAAKARVERAYAQAAAEVGA